LEEPGVDGRILLRWIFRKWDVGDMDWIDGHVESPLHLNYCSKVEIKLRIHIAGKRHIITET